jgi:large subunit ribosomal protein L3
MSSERTYPEGLLGKKIGMTQVFTAEGECVPVTVVQAGPCYVLDVRKTEKNGYSAVQLGFEPRKMQRVNKAETGHFARSGQGAFSHVKEVRCDVEKLGWTDLGKELKVGDVFKDGESVDVSGVSIGRGFQGVVRRHHIKGQPSTRGTHEYRRHVGAIGCRKFPGRVHPGKRMPGRMGGENVTVENIEVVSVNVEENTILLRGGVPGPRGGLVVIRKAKRNYGKAA